MLEWLSDLGMFVVQSLVVAAIVAICLVMIVKSRGTQGTEDPRHLVLEELNQQRRRRRNRLRLAKCPPGERKSMAKRLRRDAKSERRGKGDKAAICSTVWVLDFHGDLKASGTQRFAEEISAVIDAADEGDEVVVRLESPGGLVHAYGHAAAEMDRLRQAGLSTTICIDKVAASGGYMMACCGDRLRAAPFAVLGSIGVVAQVPNVHRFLKRHDVDVEVLTAGQHKRTLTVLGENTEEGREKFLEELDTVHSLFKQHVSERRPGLNIQSVATGESWYGRQALEKGLIDELGTSEAYLMERVKEARVITLALQHKPGMVERLGLTASAALERLIERGVEALNASEWLKR